MEFIIVTGLSGAGKSRVVTALEDIGYYCVDNMPKAAPTRGALYTVGGEPVARRNGGGRAAGRCSATFMTPLCLIRQMGSDYKILFLDCEDQVLARRYKETRRQHPLVSAGFNNVQDAIAAERELLKPCLIAQII